VRALAHFEHDESLLLLAGKDLKVDHRQPSSIYNRRHSTFQNHSLIRAEYRSSWRAYATPSRLLNFEQLMIFINMFLINQSINQSRFFSVAQMKTITETTMLSAVLCRSHCNESTAKYQMNNHKARSISMQTQFDSQRMLKAICIFRFRWKIANQELHHTHQAKAYNCQL